MSDREISDEARRIIDGAIQSTENYFCAISPKREGHIWVYGRQIDDLRLKWRPIVEAPKDGSWLLLARFSPTELLWASRGHWSEKWNNWNDGLEPSGLAGPTHFIKLSSMLLPEDRA